jgi:hypothetical protein
MGTMKVSFGHRYRSKEALLARAFPALSVIG